MISYAELSQAHKGFRAGGANIPLSDTCLAELGEPLSAYESDDLWSYEIGTKLGFFNDRLQVNATGYLIQWDDIQTSVSFSLACGISGYIANGGEAESKGVEFDLAAVVTEHIQLGMAFAYTDAEFTEDFTLSSFSVTKGTRMRDTPEWTGSAYVQYTQPIGDREGYVRGAWTYRDESNAELTNVDPLKSDSYTTVNLRAGLIGSKYEISLFVDNLTNDDPVLNPESGRSFIAGGQSTTLRPRQMGLNFKWHYR